MFSHWYKSPYAMLGELLANVGVIVQTIFFRQYEVVLFFKFRKKIKILSCHRLSNNPLIAFQNSRTGFFAGQKLHAYIKMLQSPDLPLDEETTSFTHIPRG